MVLHENERKKKTITLFIFVFILSLGKVKMSLKELERYFFICIVRKIYQKGIYLNQQGKGNTILYNIYTTVVTIIMITVSNAILTQYKR